MFDSGTRVKTPKGNGKIAYCRMKGPNYYEVECYSVVLDTSVAASKLPPFPKYAATIFPASDITKE